MLHSKLMGIGFLQLLYFIFDPQMPSEIFNIWLSNVDLH